MAESGRTGFKDEGSVSRRGAIREGRQVPAPARHRVKAVACVEARWVRRRARWARRRRFWVTYGSGVSLPSFQFAAPSRAALSNGEQSESVQWFRYSEFFVGAHGKHAFG